MENFLADQVFSRDWSTLITNPLFAGSQDNLSTIGREEQEEEQERETQSRPSTPPGQSQRAGQYNPLYTASRLPRPPSGSDFDTMDLHGEDEGMFQGTNSDGYLTMRYRRSTAFLTHQQAADLADYHITDNEIPLTEAPLVFQQIFQGTHAQHEDDLENTSSNRDELTPSRMHSQFFLDDVSLRPDGQSPYSFNPYQPTPSDNGSLRSTPQQQGTSPPDLSRGRSLPSPRSLFENHLDTLPRPTRTSTGYISFCEENTEPGPLHRPKQGDTPDSAISVTTPVHLRNQHQRASPLRHAEHPSTSPFYAQRHQEYSPPTSPLHGWSQRVHDNHDEYPRPSYSRTHSRTGLLEEDELDEGVHSPFQGQRRRKTSWLQRTVQSLTNQRQIGGRQHLPTCVSTCDKFQAEYNYSLTQNPFHLDKTSCCPLTKWAFHLIVGTTLFAAYDAFFDVCYMAISIIYLLSNIVFLPYYYGALSKQDRRDYNHHGWANQCCLYNYEMPRIFARGLIDSIECCLRVPPILGPFVAFGVKALLLEASAQIKNCCSEE